MPLLLSVFEITLVGKPDHAKSTTDFDQTKCKPVKVVKAFYSLVV